MKWLARLFFALFGANLGALAVALVEAHTLSPDVDPHERIELALSLYGVIAPVAFGLGVIGFVAFVFLEPDGSRSPRDHLASLRALPVLARTRLSALLPLCVFAAFASLVVIAHVGERVLADGAAVNAGAELSLISVGIFAAFALFALAASSPLRRLIAHAGGRFSMCLDPGVTTIIAIFACAAAFAAGIASGDTSGEGKSALAIFGVLKRHELDLDPVSHALIIVVLVYVALVVHAKLRNATVASFVLVVLCVAAPIATARSAASLNAHGAIARSIEKHGAIARVGLVTLRRASDRDRDGFSALFGGLDCDDKDPRRAPDKFDEPGNGIDEDCSGSDAPIPKPKVVVPIAIAEPTRAYNVVLITIDTLRADVGFLGYPKNVTPNLDKLAAKSTVFEHAYSMASYTGKSIGPLLIGKYPSETLRDGSHFNTYEKGNVLVTERLHDAGVFTFGCAGHWYWKPWSGITQGMDVFDLSAIPPGMGDNDDSVSGDRVSYVATKMLAKDEYTKGRFFMWIHYFDPHAQYVAHPGAPFFQTEPGGGAATRAAYDGEVWFTDQQVGKVIDAISTAPFAKDTAIIVTADHGEAFGEHNMSWHGGEIWEMLVHVPLLIYLPDGEPHRVKEKRSHIDLAPTILALEGVKSDGADLDGQSLVPDVIQHENKPLLERDVYIDMPAGPWNYVRRALITGPTPGMKVVHLGGAQYQLFDLAEDPNEKVDLATDKEKAKPFIDKLAEKRATLKEIDVKPDSP